MAPRQTKETAETKPVETETAEPVKVEKEQNNYFTELYTVNVGEHIEKKNGLSYVSWPYAWAEVKKRHPDATYQIYERETEFGPVNYFTDGKTCWVKTGVTVNGIEHIEDLPVMDFKNKSIPYASVDSMAVNKTIQRSLTKACARHGLGLYVYAGEDLPEETEEQKQARVEAETKTKAQLDELISEIQTEVLRLTADMTGPQKVDFAKTNITPVIGIPNYTKCNDVERLAVLAKKLKAA